MQIYINYTTGKMFVLFQYVYFFDNASLSLFSEKLLSFELFLNAYVEIFVTFILVKYPIKF